MDISWWQTVVHARNRSSGFYDYEDDVRIVGELLDMIMIRANSSSDPAVSVSLTQYHALARVVTDYNKAMLERKLLLAIGEVCEAHEELRAGHAPEETYFEQQYKTATTDLPDVVHSTSTTRKPEGFGIELADAHIRLLDLAAAAGVNTEARIIEKHTFNGTRPYKHGKEF